MYQLTINCLSQQLQTPFEGKSDIQKVALPAVWDETPVGTETLLSGWGWSVSLNITQPTNNGKSLLELYEWCINVLAI